MKLTTRLVRYARLLRVGLWALLDPNHPILAHLIPMRRCNLSCAYCNEFDSASEPVPLDLMLRRVERLAELGTGVVTISGGEPLMHPDLEAIVARVRERGMVATLITNGYYLSPERIERLNRAGLDHLQISIDNLEPDEVSMKSLRLLEPKLKWLAELRQFTVTINSVLGSGVRNPEDAREMGVFHEINALAPRVGPHSWNVKFQTNLALGRSNEWSCRAGSRYLYVDELGVVHYCSQQRGVPGIPLEAYTREHVKREYHTRKACAPYCTVNCVQQVAVADNWRHPQTLIARLPSRPVIVHPVPVGVTTADDGTVAG